MDKLDHGTLKQLLDQEARPAVTMYVPMHTTASPPHISENQIRFKNLVHQVLQYLPPHGDGATVAKALQAQLQELHDDLSFWEDQTPGLLLCASPQELQLFHLPIDTEEYMAVDDHFHLAPVLGLLHDVRDFYLLALAQRNPKLYQGNLYGLEAVNLRLPANAREALNIDELNQRLENQGTATGPSSKGAAGGPGQSRGWFNGRGGARNTEAEERLRYLRLLDQLIMGATDHHLALILAGTEDEVSLYRSASHYPHLLAGTIHGNHTLDDQRTLFETASKIIWSEVIVPEHQAAASEYRRISGANPSRVAEDSERIAEAAGQGRIDKLLARLSELTADTVRDQTRPMPRLTFPKGQASKRLNDVALNVWRNSGTVYNLLPDEMPSGSLMAARLRY